MPLRYFKAAKSKFLDRQDEITLKAYKNIALSFTFKGLGIAVSLLIVPLTLGYLSATDYGIWLTISALLHWVTFFDFGLSNGLRIKFAEALVKKDEYLARVFTSTAYFTIGIIGIILILAYFILYFFFSNELLSRFTDYSTPVLSELVLFVLIAFTVRLTAGLIYALLAADQKVGMVSFFELLTNIVSLVVIYLLSRFTSSSLILAGGGLSLVIALVPVLANFYFFFTRYRRFSPRIGFIQFKYAKELLKLGGTFFFLQAAVLVIFFSNNFIITAILGPEQVTTYNIAAKYLNTLTMVSVIIFNPYWSAASEAYQLQNFLWLKKAASNLLFIWLGLFFLAVLMVVASPFVYDIWIKDQVSIPYTVTVLIGVHTVLLMWNNVFGYLLNGMGKINIQLLVYSVAAVLLVPLSFIFARNLEWGLEGIILANIVCILPAAILIPLQFRQLVRRMELNSQ
ncbi:MATE family efflux transporter [Pontibacter ramchanderi]|uniref:Na+-driven multidrug efflux pump n=1 Tax=Pontibacter ramchanderi TaxID=1179743 RepID=A0A2N3U7N4_9BACT|nr:MATE family efflux transporter [Pontibacter ramchanderi]PKV62744.1 Na+-driven multidrug efflux pump [Pontibacter ramchanderi]